MKEPCENCPFVHVEKWQHGSPKFRTKEEVAEFVEKTITKGCGVQVCHMLVKKGLIKHKDVAEDEHEECVGHREFLDSRVS